MGVPSASKSPSALSFARGLDKVEAESRNLKKEGLEPASAFLLRQDPAWAHPGSQAALVPDISEMRD